MIKNRYNFNENEYEHIKKLLKELPKEKAADNFEYNLMVRINNGNFENVRTEKELFPLWKIFVPSAGIVTAVLLFFSFFNVADENSENPFRIIPQLRTEISGNLNVPLSATKKVFGQHKITNQDVVIIEVPKIDKEKAVLPKKKVRKKYAQRQGMAALPFKLDNSTNLDVAIGNKNSRTVNNIDKRATLAGMGNTSNRFYGFFIGEEIDRKDVEAMKARIDSIKRIISLQKSKLR